MHVECAVVKIICADITGIGPGGRKIQGENISCKRVKVGYSGSKNAKIDFPDLNEIGCVDHSQFANGTVGATVDSHVHRIIF